MVLGCRLEEIAQPRDGRVLSKAERGAFRVYFGIWLHFGVRLNF